MCLHGVEDGISLPGQLLNFLVAYLKEGHVRRSCTRGPKRFVVENLVD